LSGNVIVSIDAGVGSGVLDITITNEWKRFQVTDSTTTSSNNGIELRGGRGSLTADLLIWGAQCEALPFATSYIRTEGSAVTRSRDEMILNSQLNVKGTMFLNASYLGGSDKETFSRFAISFQGEDGDNRVLMGNRANINTSVISTSNGVDNPAIAGISSQITTGFRKTALVMENGTAKILSDGLLTGSSDFTFPINLKSLAIGSNSTFSGNLNGYIKTFKMYNIALTADEVKAL